MYEERIKDLVNKHSTNPNYLLGDMVLELFGITSIIKHSLIEGNKYFSAGIVIVTSDSTKSQNDITILVNNVLSEVERLIIAGQLKKESSLEVDAFGPKDFMPDMVNSAPTATSYYTEVSYHISKNHWDILCSHFSI